MNEVQMNIRHHLMLALGTRELIWDDIDKAYEENKFEYYQAYIQGGFVDDVAKTRLSAQAEERVIKVMAINSWCEKSGDYTIIYNFIKKGYRRAYNFFKKSQSTDCVVFDFFIKDQIAKKGIDSINESDIYNNIFILIFLCKENKVDFAMGNTNGMMIEYLNKFQEDVFARELREMDMQKRLKSSNVQENIDKSYEHMGITEKFFKKDDKSVGLVMDKLITENEQSLYKKTYGKPLLVNGIMNLSTKEYYDFRHSVFSYSYSKFIGVYSQLVKMLGLNEEIFGRVHIDKKEMDFLLYHYEMSVKYNGIKEEDREGLMAGMLFIYGLCALYKELKKLYLQDSKEEEHKEIARFRQEIKEKQDTLDSMLQEQKRKEKETADLLHSLQEENKALRAKEKALASELQAREDNSKEVIALREFAYNSSKEENYTEQSVSVQDKIDYINSKKVAIFGGHPIWHSKLKETFPNMILIAPERLGIDCSFVENMDAVFVHSTYCNHSMYKKLMGIIRASGCYLGYTSAVNLDITINEIYNALKK